MTNFPLLGNFAPNSTTGALQKAVAHLALRAANLSILLCPSYPERKEGRRSSLVVQWVKDPALSLLWPRLLLWYRFHPWPWNFHMPRAWQKNSVLGAGDTDL